MELPSPDELSATSTPKVQMPNENNASEPVNQEPNSGSADDKDSSIDDWLEEAVSFAESTTNNEAEIVQASSSENDSQNDTNLSALDFMMGMMPSPSRNKSQDESIADKSEEEKKDDEETSQYNEKSLSHDSSLIKDESDGQEVIDIVHVSQSNDENVTSSDNTKIVQDELIDTTEPKEIEELAESTVSGSMTNVPTLNNGYEEQENAVPEEAFQSEGNIIEEETKIDSSPSTQNNESDESENKKKSHNTESANIMGESESSINPEVTAKKLKDGESRPTPQDQLRTGDDTKNDSTEPANMIRNKFMNWRSKAEDALQNNQVLKIAQKNIEETNKKVQKAVGNNISGIAANINKAKEAAVSRNAGETEVEQDDLEDDLSYDNAEESEEGSSNDSQGSSVYVESDDEISYNSDASSIYEAQKADTSVAPSSPKRATQLRNWASKARNIVQNELSADDPTPIKRNNSSSSQPNLYKGRYEDNQQQQNRANILKQLQKRVRHPSPPPPKMVRKVEPKRAQIQESQIELMQKSIPGHIIKKYVDSLKPGQYLMLLKPGMLGVNLKQTFLPGHGVYVDYVLPGGNAEKSGVVCVGDGLVKVGDTDVSKGTIADVPTIIAKTRRPAILVFNGEHQTDVEEMDYLSTAIGAVNRILDDHNSGKARIPFNDVNESQNSTVLPDPPSKALRIELQQYASQRNNQRSSFSLISAACQQDSNLRRILQLALRICCIDGRKLPFFASFLTNNDDFGLGGDRVDSSQISTSTCLMFYLELLSFRDIFAIAPQKKKLDHANLIASKFLFASDYDSPIFDMGTFFDEHELKVTQGLLKEGKIDVDFFGNMENILEKSLISKFASFLISDECARMRAYLRGSKPYIDPSVEHVLLDSSLIASKDCCSTRNHIRFMIIYLICQLENDTLDKNFDQSKDQVKKEVKRLSGSAGGLTCAIFINRTILTLLEKVLDSVAIEAGKKDYKVASQFLAAIENLWESFIAPDGGMLDFASYSNEIYDLIEDIRDILIESTEVPAEKKEEERIVHICASLAKNQDFIVSLKKLRNELVHDYYLNHHPKYRAHVTHEWMCSEINSDKTQYNSTVVDKTPKIADGAIARFLRKLDLPKGISKHSPVHNVQKDIFYEQNQDDITDCSFNADYAMIFTAKNVGESLTSDASSQDENSVTFDPSSYERICTTALSVHGKDATAKHSLEQILPTTIVSYAMIPSIKKKTFTDLVQFGRLIDNDWEVSLVTFLAPNGKKTDESTEFLYGVTLVFNNITPKMLNKAHAITLISERNTIPAMRTTLMKMYEEKVLSKQGKYDCTSFVSFLEGLNGGKHEEFSALLKPYIEQGSAQWIDRPIVDQKKEFERASLEALTESLPPIPLALLFITAILEQKIVFTSSRRTMLVSAISGLRRLLRPLQWSHLCVPTAPTSLVKDLLQYPAPFMLGVPLDSPTSMKILKSLPDDVTLVDIDVGRVILTKRFSHNFESADIKEADWNRVLRSQVLNLAENLGNVIGSYQSDTIWRCDSPLIDSTSVTIPLKVDAVSKICRAFVEELVSGTNTCCYWICEETDEGELNGDILFDEDRFLKVKELRHCKTYTSLFDGEDLLRTKYVSSLERDTILALDMDESYLIMETFLRGQSMSLFISSQEKEMLPFW